MLMYVCPEDGTLVQAPEYTDGREIKCTKCGTVLKEEGK